MAPLHPQGAHQPWVPAGRPHQRLDSHRRRGDRPGRADHGHHHGVSMRAIATMADVLAIERQLPAAAQHLRDHPGSGLGHPRAPALSFFLRVQDHERPKTWSYESFFARITARANFFHGLGIGKDDVVAFVLPESPGNASDDLGRRGGGHRLRHQSAARAGSDRRAAQCRKGKMAGDAGALPRGGLVFEEVRQSRCDCARPPGASSISLGVPASKRRGRAGGSFPSRCRVAGARLHRGHRRDRSPVSARVIRPDDLSSFFCTGGTTGTPKIAMRTHANEVANAWSAGQLFGDAIGAGKTIFAACRSST